MKSSSNHGIISYILPYFILSNKKCMPLPTSYLTYSYIAYTHLNSLSRFPIINLQGTHEENTDASLVAIFYFTSFQRAPLHLNAYPITN